MRKPNVADRVFVKTEAGIATPPLAGITPFDRIPSMPIFDERRRRQLAGSRPIGVELRNFPKYSFPQSSPQQSGITCGSRSIPLGDGFLPGTSDKDALRGAKDVRGRLAAAGVTVFQTDEPEALVEYRKASLSSDAKRRPLYRPVAHRQLPACMTLEGTI